jgi:hypothetical protein
VCAAPQNPGGEGGQPSVDLLIEAFVRKDDDMRRKDEELRQQRAELRQKEGELVLLRALVHNQRERSMTELRLARVVSVRGALDVLLRGVPGSGLDALLVFLSTELGVATMACCNLNAKVVSDNGNRLHTLESLAQVLRDIKRRLDKDAHPGRDSQSYRDAGEYLELSPNGLSVSDVTVLACLFGAHNFPVRIVDAVPPAAGSEPPA